MKRSLLLTLFLIFSPSLFAVNILPKNYSGNVKFIQQIELKANFEGYNFSELSGLAYDSIHKRLYMVSDEGILFAFKASFSNSNVTLQPLSAHYLKRKNGKRLKKSKRDSEDIVLNKKGEIFIAFEGKPKIAKFRKNGIKIKNIKLPKVLKNAKLRSKNKSLESLTFHPKYGFITALEYPQKGDKREYQTLYSTSGKIWHIKLDPIKKNAITAIEVMDDGNLLILERAFLGYFKGYTITLRKVFIHDCKKGICKSQKILQMQSKEGWQLENFEGLAKVGRGRYLLISDDNENPFQRTLLLYLEIKK